MTEPVECPPGVHSIFDPCPGDCGKPIDDEPSAPWTQLEARAFNAVQPALKEVGAWLPLSVRRKVARSVLAELKPELDQLDALRSDLARHEEAIGELNEANIGLARRAARAEAANERVRALAEKWIAVPTAGVYGPDINSYGRLILTDLDEEQP